MARFGRTSLSRLSTCADPLQHLFSEVVQGWDCSILCGHRGEEEQNKAYAEKKSKLKFPQSTHNPFPSKGIDVAPYYSEAPHIRWNDTKGFYAFAGYVMALAEALGIKVRWGGDWDGDKDMNDQSFNDLVHWELVE